MNEIAPGLHLDLAAFHSFLFALPFFSIHLWLPSSAPLGAWGRRRGERGEREEGRRGEVRRREEKRREEAGCHLCSLLNMNEGAEEWLCPTAELETYYLTT